MKASLNNKTMTSDDLDTLTTDIAIRIVNELVEQGLVKDCTDTDDWIEFEFQDTIKEVLTKQREYFKD